MKKKVSTADVMELLIKLINKNIFGKKAIKKIYV